jgi:hypothetical protein
MTGASDAKGQSADSPNIWGRLGYTLAFPTGNEAWMGLMRDNPRPKLPWEITGIHHGEVCGRT